MTYSRSRIDAKAMTGKLLVAQSVERNLQGRSNRFGLTDREAAHAGSPDGPHCLLGRVRLPPVYGATLYFDRQYHSESEPAHVLDA